MIALYRICLVSFYLHSAIARCSMAAPDTPKAEGDTAPDETANVLKPVVVNPGDPLSAEMSAAETARVDEILEEVQQLWQQAPHTPLPADLKTQRSTERIGGYNAWVRELYVDAWRVHGKHDPRWDDEAANWSATMPITPFRRENSSPVDENCWPMAATIRSSGSSSAARSTSSREPPSTRPSRFCDRRSINFRPIMHPQSPTAWSCGISKHRTAPGPTSKRRFRAPSSG